MTEALQAFDMQEIQDLVYAERKLLAENSNEYFEARLRAARVLLDGQYLHPKLQYLMETGGSTTRFEAMEKRRENWDSPEGRRLTREGLEIDWTGRALDVSAHVIVERGSAPGRDGNAIDLLITRPRHTSRSKLPVILYFHGGGFLVGSAKALQPHAELLSYICDALVVNVEYRLAPEHKFPAAFHDGFDAYAWCVQNAASLGADPGRIAAAGDSAGGTISLAIARELAGKGDGALTALLLYYPMTDTSTDYGSYKTFGEGFGLDCNFADTFFRLVCTDKASIEHPFLRPVSWGDLSSLPPAVVAVAGFDILRDQGMRLARGIKDAGGEVFLRKYRSLNHSFIKNSGVIDDAMDACVSTAFLLRRILDRPLEDVRA